MPRWCLVPERSHHRAPTSRGHGNARHRVDCTRFPLGERGPYPASVQDINYALRWTKLSSRALKTRADLVGLSGQSSGGHLAMLVAMRPRDPHYAAIPLPLGSGRHDATVRCVVMSWPVINPLSRYRHAKRAAAGANPPEWPKSIIPRQDAYWRSEANMAEGNPMLALERGEKVETPPTVWFQGRGDVLHDYKDADGSMAGFFWPSVTMVRGCRATARGGRISATWQRTFAIRLSAD